VATEIAFVMEIEGLARERRINKDIFVQYLIREKGFILQWERKYDIV
jgi:hypothetical protein